MKAAHIPSHRPVDAKLLVVDASGCLSHAQRDRLADFLNPGDVLVANDAATIPASLTGLHLKTRKPVEVRLADSEIRYTAVGLGLLTSTAEPRGGGWDTLSEDLDAGRDAELESFVSTDDPGGKTVATLAARWTISRRR